MSLTVADVDTPLGLAEQQGGLAHVVQPPDALLALDGHSGRIDLPLQGGGALELLPRPELHGRQAERQPLGGDRQAGVHQEPADRVLAIPALLVLAAVDPAGLADPLGPPPPVGELGGVVEHHERAADAGGPVSRRAEVAGEDLAFADPVIGEEAVGRLGVGPVLAGEGDAPAHRAPHPDEQRTQPSAQPLVGEPASGDLAIDPGIRVAGHRHLPDPPRCQRARGLAVRHDPLLPAPRTNDGGNCKPVVTRVERYLGRCPCCGGATLAPVPEGMEEGSPFGVSILALALYLRFTHAISCRRLTRLFLHLFALPISEGALDGLFRRAKPRFDDEAAAILARLRRARVVCSDETTVRVDGRTHWNWVFRNEQVVIHVIRPSRGRAVVAEVLGDHRPAIWVSDLYGAQRGHAGLWQVCLAHQLRDLRHAVEAGDTVFAPRMRVLLLRAVLLARRRLELKASTRLEYRRRLERELDRTLALQPTNRHGQRLRKRYLAVRDGLFTFLEHPEAPPDNNGSERELRPMATYRKVTGGVRSAWGPGLCAAVASVVGTAARRGIDAYHAILAVLRHLRKDR